MKHIRSIQGLLGMAVVAFAAFVACASDEAPGGSAAETCAKDADCGAGRCSATWECVECVLDTDCSADSRCAAGACQPAANCVSPSDCEAAPGAPVCSPAGVCVGCVSAADCGGAACEGGNCKPLAQCSVSAECDAGLVCHEGVCIECASAADCAPGAQCLGGQCAEPCQAPADCTGGELCDAQLGLCVGCVTDNDCAEAYHCASSRCAQDVCAAGESTCDVEANARLTCAEDGRSMVPLLCPAETTCAVTDEQAECQPWVCTPGTATCSEDGKASLVCEDGGLGYQEPVDCSAEGGTCENGACKDVVCTPNEKQCKGSSVFQCNALGTTESLLQACTSTQYCQEATATCQAQQCTPNAAICNGDLATTCAADGSAPVVGGTDCTDDDKVCFAGECRESVCTGNWLCQSGSVYACTQSGTATVLYDQCYSGEYCSAGVSFCQVDACTQGASMCVGNTRTTCNADGSGPVPGGTDCGTDLCMNGACVPVVCTPNAYTCDASGNVVRCNATGTATTVYDACNTSEYCTAGSSFCRTDVCTANGKYCVGNTASVCAADGSGPVAGGTDCGADVCVSGNCLPRLCTAYSYFCQAGNVQYCGSDGTTSSLADTCTAAEFCRPGTSYCLTDVCTPGAPYCNGARVSTCAGDGSGAANAGTDCPSGQACNTGSCQPIVCTPSVRFCSGGVAGDARTCNATGTASTLYYDCAPSQFCDESTGSAVCRADVCTANAPICQGEQPGVCDANGTGPASLGAACPSSQVCTFSGCAATDTFYLSSSTTSVAVTAGRIYLMTYSVDTERTLTEIQQYASVSGTSQFEWVVYEGASQGGLFTRIFSVLNTSSGSPAFHSSGAISVPLTPGMFYAIGVRIVGAHTVYTGTQTLPVATSFGKAFGGTVFSDAPLPLTVYPSSGTLRYSAITTAP